jgi:predicted transcriptional regulator
MKKLQDRYVSELERRCTSLEYKCKTRQTVILKLLELLKKSELIKRQQGGKINE